MTFKRPAVNKFTPRIVGETSGAVFDAIASSSKSQLPLQAWEHSVFGYICGNNDIVPVPTFPKLEQPADFAPPPQPDVVDASVVAIDKDPVFTYAVKMHYLNHWRLTDEVTEDFLPFTSAFVYGYLRHLKSNMQSVVCC